MRIREDCNFLRRNATTTKEPKGISVRKDTRIADLLSYTKLDALHAATAASRVRKRKLNRKRTLPFSFFIQFVQNTIKYLKSVLRGVQNN